LQYEEVSIAAEFSREFPINRNTWVI